MVFVLSGFVIFGCSNNEKIIKERIVRLTEDYFNSTNERPNIDSLKSNRISE